MDKQIISIVDENGSIMEVDLVSILLSPKEDKTYLVYTDGKEDENGFISLAIAILDEENNELSISAIESDEEFMYAQKLLQEQVGNLIG